MIFFKLWIFDFNLSSLVSFLIGILAGFAILSLIYAILVVSSLKRKKYSDAPNLEITDEEIKVIINNAQTCFKDKNLKGAKNSISYCFNLSETMVKDISRKFYPNSKRPFAELSVDEVLILTHYIANRIDEMLERPGLRLLKKLKISTILSMNDVKQKVDDSSLMKLTKKYKLKKVFEAIKGGLNFINPVYWIRKLVINTSLDFAINKLCLVVLCYVGEETYKVYSKRVFNEEKVIDMGSEELLKEVNDELQAEEVTEEQMDAYVKDIDREVSKHAKKD